MFLVVNTGQMYQLLIVIIQCAKSHDLNDKMAAKCYVHKHSLSVHNVPYKENQL